MEERIFDAEFEESNTEEKKEESKSSSVKTEFTEEEAKIAAENIGELLKGLESFKTVNERRVEKMKKLQALYETLPEDHWKRKSIEIEIFELGRKVNPNIVWDSSKQGTYKKKED